MHITGKGNIYNVKNPGIEKLNTLTFPLDCQSILIPHPGYPLSQETPLRAYRPCGHRITKYYIIGVLPLYGAGKYYKNKEGGTKYLGHGFGRGYGFGKRVALAQNRAVGATKEPIVEQEWQEYKPNINNNSITVKALINRVSFKLA